MRWLDPVKRHLDLSPPKFAAETNPLHRQALVGKLRRARVVLLERALGFPSSVAELAKAYGYEMPTVGHVTELQNQLSEVKQRESKRTLDEFMKDKPYFGDTNFQSAVAAEDEGATKRCAWAPRRCLAEARA